MVVKVAVAGHYRTVGRILRVYAYGLITNYATPWLYVTLLNPKGGRLLVNVIV